MDAGELEADIAFKAGADLVSVLGSADDSTIAGAVKAAKAHNKGIVVDLIGVADKVTRAKEVRALGAKFVEIHAGLDEQAKPGFDLNGLLRAGEEARVPFSVAGGVNARHHRSRPAGRRRRGRCRRRHLRRSRPRPGSQGTPRGHRLALPIHGGVPRP